MNIELAKKVLEQIEAAPRRWRQSTWLTRPYPVEEQDSVNITDNCETAGCFAGWACVLAGYKGDAFGIVPSSIPPALRAAMSRGFAGEYTVKDAARVTLGLSPQQAADLFAAGNSLSLIYDYLEEYTQGDITPLPRGERPAWYRMGPDELDDYWWELAEEDR